MEMKVGRGRVMTTRAMEVMSSANSSKRRKTVFNVDDQLVNYHYDVNSPENSVSPATSAASERITVSDCSSNESTEFGKDGLISLDLKVEPHAKGFERIETEISTLINCRFSRETTPSSELCADTDELESSAATKLAVANLRRKHPVAKMPSAPSNELCAETDELESSTATKPSAANLRRKHPVTKIPSAAEIEEFFGEAEKYEQKLFADKYNYDIMKDVPMEGRYQWIRLKP